MKTRLLILSILIMAFAATAQEADLYSYKSSDGHCVAHAMAIQSGQELEDTTQIPDSIVIEAEKRSIDFYRAYSNLYTVCENDEDAPQTCPLNVETKLVSAKSDLVWDEFSGIIVKVDMGADEDMVAFYFGYESYHNKLFLTLAFHSEQSPEAFWICEY